MTAPSHARHALDVYPPTQEGNATEQNYAPANYLLSWKTGNGLDRTSRVGLPVLICFLSWSVKNWLYVGYMFTNRNLHPYLPFSSFSMWSFYKSRKPLEIEGAPWTLGGLLAASCAPLVLLMMWHSKKTQRVDKEKDPPIDIGSEKQRPGRRPARSSDAPASDCQ